MTDTPAADEPMPTSYEQARTELGTIVRALEAGSQSLEESLALWERGEKIAALCAQWLQGARDRLAAADGQDGDDGPDDDER
jgi:exodeoxyribonuclease VII small subunit